MLGSSGRGKYSTVQFRLSKKLKIEMKLLFCREGEAI